MDNLQHIAIIMDGNGRWAKKRGLPRSYGHRQGADTVKKIVRYAQKIGVKILTLYAFSTENWSRPKDEINEIMDLLSSFLNDAQTYRNEDVKVNIIGDVSPLSDEMKQSILLLQDETKHKTSMVLNIALNYGGRQEIVSACKAVVGEVMSGKISADDINEEVLADFLYTRGQHDPDLIIRPSGEKRISNFLLWQCAYSEFVFMDILWPDFSEKNLDAAIKEYFGRTRRFGGI